MKLHKTLLAMTPADMAFLRPDKLAAIDAEIAAMKEEYETALSLYEHAISAKYTDEIARAYSAKGVSTGSVTIVDGEYVLNVTTPKIVDWDDNLLRHAEATIRDSWKGDPEEYITLKRTVSEAAYKAWPEAIKTLFSAARTERAGKPKVKITRKEKS